MKKTRTTTLIALLLCACTVFGLTACTGQEDIDNAVMPLSEQMTTVSATLAEMQTLDTTLNGHIDALEAKAATLEAALSAVNTTLETLEESSATKAALLETKTALEGGINTVKADITALQAKDTALDGKITALQTALSTEITDTKAWIEETFATKTACDTLKTEINAMISALDGRVEALETSVESLEATANGLQQDIDDLKNALNDLQIRINCLEGKHVINEAATVSYTYTWAEAAPNSTCDYICLHCEKEVKNETVLPSVWKVGDKVTYVAKDGNSYVSTVGEVTDSKAVLVSDEVLSETALLTSEEQFLALLEPVGARYPYSNEAVYAEIIEPWLLATLKVANYNTLSYHYSAEESRYYVVYKSETSTPNGSPERRISQINYYKWESTYYFRYIWDVEFSTAE